MGLTSSVLRGEPSWRNGGAGGVHIARLAHRKKSSSPADLSPNGEMDGLGDRLDDRSHKLKGGQTTGEFDVETVTLGVDGCCCRPLAASGVGDGPAGTHGDVLVDLERHFGESLRDSMAAL